MSHSSLVELSRWQFAITALYQVSKLQIQSGNLVPSGSRKLRQLSSRPATGNPPSFI